MSCLVLVKLDHWSIRKLSCSFLVVNIQIIGTTTYIAETNGGDDGNHDHYFTNQSLNFGDGIIELYGVVNKNYINGTLDSTQ